MHSPCICICSTCSGLLLCLSVKYLSSPIGQPCCIACVVVIWSQCCGSVAWADWQSQKLGANAHRLVVHHITATRTLVRDSIRSSCCKFVVKPSCGREQPVPVNDAFQLPWWIMAASGDLWFVNTRFNYKKQLQQNSKLCVQYGEETMNRRQKEDVIMQHTTIQAQCNRVLPIF